MWKDHANEIFWTWLDPDLANYDSNDAFWDEQLDWEQYSYDANVAELEAWEAERRALEEVPATDANLHVGKGSTEAPLASTSTADQGSDVTVKGSTAEQPPADINGAVTPTTPGVTDPDLSPLPTKIDAGLSWLGSGPSSGGGLLDRLANGFAGAATGLLTGATGGGLVGGAVGSLFFGVGAGPGAAAGATAGGIAGAIGGFVRGVTASPNTSALTVAVDAGRFGYIDGALGGMTAPMSLARPVISVVAAKNTQSTALVVYDPEFAARQILGNTTTPGGRTVMDHAARRMTNPPAGRAPMTMQEIDQVLDTGDKIRKLTPHPQGTTVTVQSTTMPGKPQVVIDAATGKRVITVIKSNKSN